MHGKKYGKLMLIINLLLFLCACGNPVESNNEVTLSQETEKSWKEDSFISGDRIEDSLLHTVDYETIEFSEPKNTVAKTVKQIAYGENFFLLDTFYTATNTTYQLQRIGAEEETETISISPTRWGISNGIIMSMDVLDSEQCVFFVASHYTTETDKRKVAEHYYAIYTDYEGNEIRRVDILDVLKEMGIWTNQAIAYLGTEINCDTKGNIYILDNEQHTIYLLDSDGKLITSYIYQVDMDNRLVRSFRTNEGELIFVCKYENQAQFICLGTEGGETKLFFGTDLENVFRWYGLNGNVLYYATNEKIIGWNITTGEKKALLNFAENQIVDVINTSLIVSDEGIRLIALKDTKRLLISLSEEKPEREEKITLVNVSTNNAFLKGRITAFSQENPLYATAYEDLSKEDESIRRILMEVVNGEGPDILFVSREDVENLQANDALADLNQILSEEVLENLLPGVIAMGTYNGKLVGIPLCVNARTMLANQTYWKEQTWTIKDIVNILEEQKDLKGIFLDMFGQDNYFYNMYYILGMDVENSPYIQKEKANFDSPEFQNLLKQIKDKTNSLAGVSSYDMIAKALKEGEYLGIEYLINNMAQFCSIYEKIGDNVCIAGYPTETGCGNYIQANGLLVVNQKSIEKEEVKKLLDYLFSMESQQLLSSGISVRRDIPLSMVKYDENSNDYYWVNGDGRKDLLTKKEDGTSYLEEYMSFISCAVPYSIGSDELFNIIMEEAESYFHDDKTVSEVSKIIQSRIQLYLDEK